MTLARAAARWALALARSLPLVWSLPLGAQDRPTFDPSRDLEGFEACYSSDFRELYVLEEYSALVGKELTPPELDEVRARWRASRESGDAQLRAIQTDPAGESLWLLRHRLGRSSYFSKITLLEDRSVPGFVFVVQRPPKDVPDYAAQVAANYGPWLSKLGSVFDEEYAKPLGLTRPRKHAVWAIGVLASLGDYQNYWRIHPNPCANAGWACYDTKLGLVVGYDDPFQPGVAAADRRYPLLHAAVREMIFAHATARDGRPWAMWLEEGLASYLAYHEGLAPDCLAERRIRPSTLKTIVGYAQDAGKRDLVLHPIVELANLREPEVLDRLVNRRAEMWGVARPAETDVISGFYGEATLWMHFFHRARGGALRARFLEYMKWALSANGGADALRVAMAGEDLAALDREFFRWVFEEHRKWFPEIEVSPEAIDSLFAARPVGKATASRALGAEPEATPPFSPSVLAIAPSEIEARHGQALLQARAGDLEGAISAMTAIADSKPASPEDARAVSEIDRDLERLRELALLRDGFLASLRRTGSKWSIDFEGQKLVASVLRVEGGFVFLSENRLGIEKIPLAAVDLLEVARQAGKKEQQGESKPWTRFYAYVLAGDAKWEKLLKSDTDAARALREDAKSWYPTRIRSGEAATAVEGLVRAGLPKTGGEGRAACDAIRSLITDSGDLPVVQRRIGDLRKLAAAAVGAVLAEESPASLLHGKWKDLGEGRVSVAYEFNEAAEARDFVKQIGYMAEWRKGFQMDVGKEAESSWQVRDGSFRGVGAACYRFPLAFSAPMTVRYELEVDDQASDEKSQANFSVGLCDDGNRSQILVLNFGELFIRNGPQRAGMEKANSDEPTYFLSTDYQFEVRHDGERVSVLLDGEVKDEESCLGRKSGDVLLWFHTTLPVSIGRLEIEGKIDPASAAELRRSRVEETLVEWGFPR